MTKQEETELRNVLVGSTRVSRRMIQILEKNDLICTKGKNALQDTAAGWERIYILFRGNSVRCEGRDEQF